MATITGLKDSLDDGNNEADRLQLLTISATQSMSPTTQSNTANSTTQASVSDAVFLTTELLENILRFLPMKDLLLAQRVAQKWRAVISESKQLQQALFFLPQEPEGHWSLPWPAQTLQQITQEEYEQAEDEQKRYDGEWHSIVLTSGSLNPLVFESRSWGDPADRASCGGEEFFRFRHNSPPSNKYLFASWYYMSAI